MSSSSAFHPDRDTFRKQAVDANVVPLIRTLFADQITPVLGYRRLVRPDERAAPSFLLESVDAGGVAGRYSFVGAQPVIEVIARGHEVEIVHHERGTSTITTEPNPLDAIRRLSADWRVATEQTGRRIELPEFRGGWVGYAGYDTARWSEPDKLPFESAPPDDRALPDLHFGLYPYVAIFDNVTKVVHAVVHVLIDQDEDVDAAYDRGRRELDAFVERLETHTVPLPAGALDLDPSARSSVELPANFTREGFETAVERTKGYIAAGDAFQVVLSQRFDRRTTADPFDIYRSLRIVNPSPYMIYLQARGSILIASSPEILCRVDGERVVNRPLAGTRKRGTTPEEDAALEADLLADDKETAEHIMLVDLGRNDLGRVCEVGSIVLDRVLDVERYSHVMHLSSTVSGSLRRDLDRWDLLQSTLPVGTVSGAPKVRAMQIIDELEPTRRGPYAGGIGHAGFGSGLDMAIALRTIVIPTDSADGSWSAHLQAGAGIVADSVPANEYDETVNKAAALNRAVDLAERAFGDR